MGRGGRAERYVGGHSCDEGARVRGVERMVFLLSMLVAHNPSPVRLRACVRAVPFAMTHHIVERIVRLAH